MKGCEGKRKGIRMECEEGKKRKIRRTIDPERERRNDCEEGKRRKRGKEEGV